MLPDKLKGKFSAAVEAELAHKRAAEVAAKDTVSLGGQSASVALYGDETRAAAAVEAMLTIAQDMKFVAVDKRAKAEKMLREARLRGDLTALQALAHTCAEWRRIATGRPAR